MLRRGESEVDRRARQQTLGGREAGVIGKRRKEGMGVGMRGTWLYNRDIGDARKGRQISRRGNSHMAFQEDGRGFRKTLSMLKHEPPSSSRQFLSA